MLVKARRKILAGAAVLIALGLALAAALVAYLLVFHNHPLTLPAPTGPYSVGRSEYDWVDAGRSDPLADQADQKRELPVWVWYPATPSPQSPLAPYLPPVWISAPGQDQGAGAYLQSDFASIRTHAFVDAPLAGAGSAYPVLLMQPGMGPVPTDYTVLAENLASQGYIVFGINQPYTSSVVVFPDGRVALRTTKGVIPENADAATVDQDANRIQKVWAADAIFVMDQLQNLNADPASRFYQRLDLAHIGLFGHSFGGATAVRVCELDARCKASADLDGTLFSAEVNGEALRQPALFMTEEACDANCATMRQMVATATGPAYLLSLAGARHFNFSDLPLRLLPLARVLFKQLDVIGSIAPERGLGITNAYLLAFFDQYLKGVPTDLLGGPSPAYPEVQFAKR